MILHFHPWDWKLPAPLKRLICSCSWNWTKWRDKQRERWRPARACELRNREEWTPSTRNGIYLEGRGRAGRSSADAMTSQWQDQSWQRAKSGLRIVKCRRMSPLERASLGNQRDRRSYPPSLSNQIFGQWEGLAIVSVCARKLHRSVSLNGEIRRMREIVEGNRKKRLIGEGEMLIMTWKPLKPLLLGWVSTKQEGTQNPSCLFQQTRDN